MINPERVYKYRVERVKHGKWIPLMQTDIEDADTFGLIANAEEYQYRILRDSEDVTHLYKKQLS
jgi:hypothetical protein